MALLNYPTISAQTVIRTLTGHGSRRTSPVYQTSHSCISASVCNLALYAQFPGLIRPNLQPSYRCSQVLNILLIWSGLAGDHSFNVFPLHCNYLILNTHGFVAKNTRLGVHRPRRARVSIVDALRHEGFVGIQLRGTDLYSSGYCSHRILYV